MTRTLLDIVVVLVAVAALTPAKTTPQEDIKRVVSPAKEGDSGRDAHFTQCDCGQRLAELERKYADLREWCEQIRGIVVELKGREQSNESGQMQYYQPRRSLFGRR